MINEFRGEYRFLSNFWPCDIEIDGLTFPSAEHAYQAHKTLNAALRTEITRIENPGQSKRFGGSIELRSDWERVKVGVMFRILCQKFSEPILAQMLLETHPHELVEGNSWGDTFWGVDNQTGDGENWLGGLLMLTRSLLYDKLIS